MKHDCLYRECRECCCADNECKEATFDKIAGAVGIVAFVVFIVLLARGPWA